MVTSYFADDVVNSFSIFGRTICSLSLQNSCFLKSAMTIYALHWAKGGRLSGTFTITPTQTKYRRNGDKNNIQELMIREGYFRVFSLSLTFSFSLSLSFSLSSPFQFVAAGNGQPPWEGFQLEFISLVQSCTNTNILFRCLAYFWTS